MGIVADDVKNFVENYLGDLSLEFDVGGYLNRDRTWPDGTTRSAVAYWADNTIEFDWSHPDPPYGFGWLSDLMYMAGEELESALEWLLTRGIEVGIWLLDVLWTDLILNTLIKWAVWIIAAGLRVVFGAPFYRMGRSLVLTFLEKIDNKNVHRFFETIIPEAPLTGASDENARVDLSSLFSTILGNPAFEGFMSSTEDSPLSEFLTKISESDFFSQGA